MGTRERKERKRAGVKFERTPKVPTGTYRSKRDEQKAKKAFMARVEEAITKVAAEKAWEADFK